MFQPRRFAIRLSGNFLVSFLSPVLGLNVVLDISFTDTILASLLSAVFVTGIVAGREFERYKE